MEYKKYNIISLSDDWYAQQLCVTIYSTIKNFSKKNELGFYVLDNWISEENKQKIVDSCKMFNVPIVFLKADCSEFKKYTGGKFNESTFARLYIEKLFPRLDKILYIDSDTVVDWDLAKLFDIDISHYSVWAVRCEFDLSDEELMTTYKHMWVWNPMFSCGVILINLIWWRKNHVFNKSILYLEENWKHLAHMDQDVLNNLLHNTVLFIPPKYNATNSFFYTHFYEETCYTKQEYLSAKKKPIVIHFAWWSKPWHWQCFHKWNKIWRQYNDETLFVDSKLNAKYYFKLERYKMLLWRYFSNILSIFWFKFYTNCKKFWRNYVI